MNQHAQNQPRVEINVLRVSTGKIRGSIDAYARVCDVVRLVASAQLFTDQKPVVIYEIAEDGELAQGQSAAGILRQFKEALASYTDQPDGEMPPPAITERLAGIVQAWTAFQSIVPLKPICSEDEYEAMRKITNQLADNLDETDGPIDDLFGVVTDLMHVWESRKKLDLPKAAPGEVLRFLLDSHNLKQNDLADIVSESTVSDILSGRRAISKQVAVRLAARFRTDPSAFL